MAVKKIEIHVTGTRHATKKDLMFTAQQDGEKNENIYLLLSLEGEREARYSIPKKDVQEIVNGLNQIMEGME